MSQTDSLLSGISIYRGVWSSVGLEGSSDWPSSSSGNPSMSILPGPLTIRPVVCSLCLRSCVDSRSHISSVSSSSSSATVEGSLPKIPPTSASQKSPRMLSHSGEAKYCGPCPVSNSFATAMPIFLICARMRKERSSFLLAYASKMGCK